MDKMQEVKAVTAAVQKYIDGIAETELEKIIEAFHPNATMTRVTDGDITFTPNVGPHIAKFMEGFPPTSAHSPDFKGRIVDVRVHGSMASVEIAEDQLTGQDMKTFFQLHKGASGWIITAKATWAPD